MEEILLIITSVLHYFAFIPVIYPYRDIKIPKFNAIYAITIISSVIISGLYHYYIYVTPYAILFGVIDYIIIGLWFVLDILWCFLLNKPIIIYLNMLVFFLNILVMFTNNYTIYHGLWHVIFAIKSCYVSYLIFLYDKKF
jgi:hypothetical protein